MNEGGVQGTNDEEEDIYKDIGDFRFDKELAKLEESNKAYLKDIVGLKKRLNELTERNETLERVNEVLATNISILLKTAKAEIDRKQLVIDEFRQKIEVLNKRHGGNERNCFQRSESFRNCGNEVFKDNYKSDIEEGEIVQDETEEGNINSDSGKTDESNNRDRGYHLDNNRKRRKSRERSKGRSNDISSKSRKSRNPDENYSRHFSSSRSYHRSTSPDTRGHYDSRTRSSDKNRYSSRSGHSHGSRSRKTENSPHRREESSGKSRERRRSVSKKDIPKLKKDDSVDRNRDEKSKKSECQNDKGRLVKSPEPRKEEKEMETEENCNVVKILSMAEYRQRKSGEGKLQKKSECDVLTRQSVLADLYDKPVERKIFPEVPKDISVNRNASIPEVDNGEEGGNDCSSGSGCSQLKNKGAEQIKGPRTLYSRRMEAKIQQQQIMEDALSRKSSKDPCEKQENDGTASGVREQTGEIDIRSEKVTEESRAAEKKACEQVIQAGKEEIMSADCSSEMSNETASESNYKSTEVNLEQSFGESLVKKLLQLQATKENVGINEFSPLKNNYKLSKISPLKPVSKQHILEYYNLKPSPQQLNNIEPEILDFSFSLPETPGKNFLNSFLPLSDAKECENREGNGDKCGANSPKEESPKAGDSKSGGESGIEEFIIVEKPNMTKKRSCKTGKTLGNDMSESKKLVQTLKEGGEQGKSYTTRYQIRMRSKTEYDKIGPNEAESFDKTHCGKSTITFGGEGGIKRERRLTLSDEDISITPKRMKCGTPKMENGTSIEVAAEDSVPDDITSFEVFRNVSSETVGDMDVLVQHITRIEEKTIVEDPLPWNGGDYTVSKVSSNEEDAAQMAADKMKPSLSSTGNSADSSTFKVLRSYLMLSANDDTEESDNTSTDSGEYSDSGASALVDLL